jgi:predicted TIM-barrel fold metal-dependent hydrolase
LEDADFLEKHADPKYREALRINGGAGGGELFEKHFAGIMENVRQRLTNPTETAALEQNVIGAKMKGWFAHGAVDGAERSRTLDLLGFKGQLVFSTFAAQFLASKDLDLVYAGARAHTRAMVDFCSSDERLMPVALIPLSDPERAIAELEAAVELGCRAIHVPSDAPGGNRHGFSPAHADLDGFWARFEEMGVALMLHIGGGKLLPRAYHNNGRPKPTDWLGGGENLRGKDFHAVHHSPENFLAAMILDGIFDRHPGLRCGVIEQGASWVPGMMRNLDHAMHFKRTEPLLQSLELMPSEYIRRQVKFTPFCFEDVGWLIEQCGDELFLFSSDYPHPEGGSDPIKRFEESMDAAATPSAARQRFYEDNFVDLMAIEG